MSSTPHLEMIEPELSDRRLDEMCTVQIYAARIREIAGVVYGNPNALDVVLTKIQMATGDPRAAADFVAEIIVKEPQRFAPLAGPIHRWRHLSRWETYLYRFLRRPIWDDDLFDLKYRIRDFGNAVELALVGFDGSLENYRERKSQANLPIRQPRPQQA